MIVLAVIIEGTYAVVDPYATNIYMAALLTKFRIGNYTPLLTIIDKYYFKELNKRCGYV